MFSFVQDWAMRSSSVAVGNKSRGYGVPCPYRAHPNHLIGICTRTPRPRARIHPYFCGNKSVDVVLALENPYYTDKIRHCGSTAED